MGADSYEYCPACNANLRMQKGYDPSLPYWICLGCREMLINPELETSTDIIWRCDGCGDLLNTQDGFDESKGEFVCLKCGFSNSLEDSAVFESEDEYLSYMKDPYRGLSDEDVLALLAYSDIGNIDNRKDIIITQKTDTKKVYVKKYLTRYNKNVYEYLLNNPIEGMPKIVHAFESSNCLIVIEEYIEGRTLEQKLEDGPLDVEEAVRITTSICEILHRIHTLPVPIIHRDIKPSNVIVGTKGRVWLLDMNVAKWDDGSQKGNTTHVGTVNYASPEQAGYGIKGTGTRSDIYSVGVMLNVMLTGEFPKEKLADNPLGEIVLKCIDMDPDKRYSALQLKLKLNKYVR